MRIKSLKDLNNEGIKNLEKCQKIYFLNNYIGKIPERFA